MIWIAPSEKDTDNAALEKRLWDAADQFRANSGLKSQESSAPVLGLIFLRFAEVRFAAQRAKLEKASASACRGSRVDEPAAYHAEGILYLPAEARFDYLLNRPEAENIGAKVNTAMRDIEKHNPQLAGVLPKTYNLFTSTLLKELLKKVSEIPASLDYDAFGRILGPACGSGGMFVSSARFVSEHKKNPAAELSIHGVEKTDETGRLCRLNLAVHGLEGEIKRAKIQEIFGEAADSKTPRSALRAPRYQDMPGLCRAATLKGIEAQGWSLNPGRHMGVAVGEAQPARPEIIATDITADLESALEQFATIAEDMKR